MIVRMVFIWISPRFMQYDCLLFRYFMLSGNPMVAEYTLIYRLGAFCEQLAILPSLLHLFPWKKFRSDTLKKSHIVLLYVDNYLIWS